MAVITYEEAAHLGRRMGFGFPPDDLNGLVSRGREGAVDFLIDYKNVDNKPMEDVIGSAFSLPGFYFSPLLLQQWWLTRMMLTRRPFEEKMTLFWHNHFATSYTKVAPALMYVQNNLLRDSALERFDDLLLRVSRDAAMLFWLDGITNIAVKPNENFARELQELFTMGPTEVISGRSNYTEKDVKEIARAFTGWKVRFKRNRLDKPKFYVNNLEHDNGPKEIYGRVANFSGEDAVTTICARIETGRFLAKKLFEFFVYPLTNSDEDKATIQRFADIYISSDHSIRALARAIFVSDEFFSERARFALIKSPVDLVVGAVRMLGANFSAALEAEPSIPERIARMGLELFNPTDVSGWALNLGWLSTANALERYNFCNYLATNRPTTPFLRGAWLTNDQLKSHTKPTARETVENFLRVLGPLSVAPEAIYALIDLQELDDAGNRIAFVVNDETVDKNVRALVHLIMCLPEFQTN